MLGKNRVKQVLYGFEIRATAIIGNGLVHHVPKRQSLKLIQKELGRVAKYCGLNSMETNHLWLESYARYNRVSKQSFSELRKSGWKYDDELKTRKNVVYKYLRDEFKDIEHNKNEVADEYEYRAKRDNMDQVMESGEIFFLCSTHENPAKDHADWEGKIYVDEDWADKVSDEEYPGVSAYIRNHHIRTVQWVTGEPVYLIYRPNCKHYLIPVTVEEVLGSSVRRLLKKHDAYMEDEKEISYEYGQYKTYYERAKMLSYLKDMFDAEDLNKDLKQTNKLVKKWGILSKGSGRRSVYPDRASEVGKAA